MEQLRGKLNASSSASFLPFITMDRHILVASHVAWEKGGENDNNNCLFFP